MAVGSQNSPAIGKANLPKQTIWLFLSTIIVAFWAEAVNFKPSETMSQRAVLLTSDLIFSTKVTGTARALGLEIAVAADVEQGAEIYGKESC